MRMGRSPSTHFTSSLRTRLIPSDPRFRSSHAIHREAGVSGAALPGFIAGDNRSFGHEANAKFAEFLFQDHLKDPDTHGNRQRYANSHTQILPRFLRNSIQDSAQT